MAVLFYSLSLLTLVCITGKMENHGGKRRH